MTTFVVRTADPAAAVDDRLRVAIKDNIDLAGFVTTAGSRSLADHPPAATDAACLRGVRAAVDSGTAVVVGKANMHELAYGTTGMNPWFGNPVNPRHPDLIPGGSSSGSAVAVAAGDADVSIGTDTGGSVRIPAACCGVFGLKTTWGRISTDGVWPLAPSLDTVGPLARDAVGIVAGMRLLEPGFEPGGDARIIRRLRLDGPDGRVDPRVLRSVDDYLAGLALPVEEVDDPGWRQAFDEADVVLSAEAWRANRDLLARRPEGISEPVRRRIGDGSAITAEREQAARSHVERWRATLGSLTEDGALLAVPVLPAPPPPVRAHRAFRGSWFNLPVNAAGLPSLAIPLTLPDGLPAGVQLVGPSWGEEVLLGLARR